MLEEGKKGGEGRARGKVCVWGVVLSRHCHWLGKAVLYVLVRCFKKASGNLNESDSLRRGSPRKSGRVRIFHAGGLSKAMKLVQLCK